MRTRFGKFLKMILSNGRFPITNAMVEATEQRPHRFGYAVVFYLIANTNISDEQYFQRCLIMECSVSFYDKLLQRIQGEISGISSTMDIPSRNKLSDEPFTCKLGVNFPLSHLPSVS